MRSRRLRENRQSRSARYRADFIVAIWRRRDRNRKLALYRGHIPVTSFTSND